MIKRSYYFTEQEPPIIDRDWRGTLIEPGLRVAYNFSGDIAIGTIVELKKNRWKTKNKNWFLDFELHVMGENGKLSKIQNPNCFVII